MECLKERTVQNGSHVSILLRIELDVIIILTPCLDFEVPAKLPGLDFDIGASYAGNINVQRAHHQNDSLFFWGFESQNGSLTASAGDLTDRPWAVWLQGG